MATPTPTTAVAAQVQAPGSLPSAGEGAGIFDEYWRQLALLIGATVAVLGLALMLTSSPHRPD